MWCGAAGGTAPNVWPNSWATLVGFRQWPLPYPLTGQAWLVRLHAKDSGIPYGIALAIGALMIYPETEWVHAVDLDRFISAPPV